jgi:hypothetical protein
MKAARVVEFPTKNRADRIRVLLDRRDDVDRKIALELREAKAKDFKGDTAAWLAWCKREFGWSKVQAYVHLNPERLAKERARDRERKAGVRESRTDDLEYIDEDEEPDETEAERQVRWKKQVEDAQRRMKFTTPQERNTHVPLVVEMINEGFKALAKKRHPDVGGSHEAMSALAAARDWGIAFIEHPPLVNLRGGA